LKKNIQIKLEQNFEANFEIIFRYISPKQAIAVLIKSRYFFENKASLTCTPKIDQNQS
jgi:hypothetical protein